MYDDFYDDYRDVYSYNDEDSCYVHYEDWYEVESAFCEETGYEPEVYED